MTLVGTTGADGSIPLKGTGWMELAFKADTPPTTWKT
jgi:hypothetical protein